MLERRINRGGQYSDAVSLNGNLKKYYKKKNTFLDNQEALNKDSTRPRPI